MASDSSQKFIGRNRAPRVQIEYDTEVYGAQKKVNLPFVMAVMSDLKGKPQEGEDLLPVDEREFEDVDVSTFNKFMGGTKPRVTFRVPNKLGDEGGELPVDMTFTSMDDFTPAKIAEKVAPLKELLDARNQLKNLLTFMDGKANAEKLIEDLLKNPELMKSLGSSGAEKPAEGE
jgi:type VI secretion system protein ImpB